MRRPLYIEVLKHCKVESVISNKQLHLSVDSKYSNKSKILLPDIYIKDVFGSGQDAIIEFDGRQHYEYVPYLQENEWNFIKQVRRDQFLEEYCKTHNIRLLRIPWLDEKRISEIIQAFLLHGKDITTEVYPKIPPVVII